MRRPLFSLPAALSASLLVALGPVGAPGLARAQAASAPIAGSPCAAHIAEASRRFGVPEEWIARVARQESAGRPNAVSHAGAQGCMQVMPSTWADLTARYQLGSDPFDPRANMLAGAAYLRQMYDRYGSLEGTLAAYNAGPGRYDQYRLRGRPLPPETLDYLARLGPALGGRSLSSAASSSPRAAPRTAAELAASAPLFVVLSGGFPAQDQQNDAGSSTGETTPTAPVRPPRSVQAGGLFARAPTSNDEPPGAQRGARSGASAPSRSERRIAESTAASARSGGLSPDSQHTPGGLFVRISSAEAPQ